MFRSGPNQYASLVVPALVDHPEVFHGPGSVWYGSDALGGVVDYRLDDLRDAERDGTFLRFRYSGADSGFQQTVGTRGRSAGGTSYFFGLAAADYQDVDGGAQTDNPQAATGYSEVQGFLRTVTPLGGGRFTLTYLGSQQVNVPRTDSVQSGSQVKRDFDPQTLTFAILKWDGKLAIFEEFAAAVAFNNQRTDEKRVDASNLNRERNLRQRVDQMQIRADGFMAREGIHRIALMFEAVTEGVTAHRHDRNLTTGVITQQLGEVPNNATYGSFAIAAQDQMALDGGIKLNAGIRVSSHNPQADLSVFNPVFTDYDETYTDVSGSVRSQIPLDGDALTLNLSVGRGFRAPSLDDVAKFTSSALGEEVPSPGLKPEQNIGVEIGVGGSSGKASRPGASWMWRASFAQSDLLDKIIRVPGTFNGLPFIDENSNTIQDPGENDVLVKVNTDKALLQAFVLHGEVESGDWSYGGSYAWTRGVDVTNGVYLGKVPPVMVKLRARLALNPDATSWIEFQSFLVDKADNLSPSDKTDFRIPAGGTPGFAVFHVRYGWESDRSASTRWLLTAALENVGDKSYRWHGSSVDGAGRSVVLTAELRF
jgi:outer membrane receptor protein involved in Fe transport